MGLAVLLWAGSLLPGLEQPGVLRQMERILLHPGQPLPMHVLPAAPRTLLQPVARPSAGPPAVFPPCVSPGRAQPAPASGPRCCGAGTRSGLCLCALPAARPEITRRGSPGCALNPPVLRRHSQCPVLSHGPGEPSSHPGGDGSAPQRGRHSDPAVNQLLRPGSSISTLPCYFFTQSWGE